MLCHPLLAVFAWLSLASVSAGVYDDDADVFDEAAKRDYLRFGRGNHYMRFGRSDVTEGNMAEVEDDPFPRYRRADPILRIGRDKPFLRFGRPDAIIRIGRSDPLLQLNSDLESFEKREGKVYHVGKRSDPLIRIGKADPLIRFGKRRDGIIRIGRADPIIRFGRADPIIRFGKRDPIPRFEMKRDALDKTDMESLDMQSSPSSYRVTRSAEQTPSRKKRSTDADPSDVTGVKRSWPPVKKSGGHQGGYMRFGRQDFMRFGRPLSSLSEEESEELMDLLQKLYTNRTVGEVDKKDAGSYMRFGRAVNL